MGQLTTDLEQELCYLIKGQVVKFEMKCNEENIKKFSRLVSLFFKFLCGEHLAYVRVRNLSWKYRFLSKFFKFFQADVKESSVKQCN